MTPEQKTKKKAYYEAHKEARAAYQKKYDEAHREERRAYKRSWIEANKEIVKKKQRETNLAWKAKYPDKLTARRSRRRALNLCRIPPWLTPEQKKETLNFYTEARILSKSTGIPHEVDHIVPLRGKEVSGLHVPWNLQVLTAEENQNKGNNLD